MRCQLGFATTALLLLLMVIPSAVEADALEDCQQKRQLRLTACGAVIAGAYSSEEKAVAYRWRGNARTDAGALDDALLDLSEAIRLAPSDPQAHLLRGLVRVRRGDPAAAATDYSEAIRLLPRSALAYNGRGHANLVGGRIDLAIADFTQALVLSPDSASTLNNRGLAYRKAGNLDRAIADYTAAIASNPIYALAYSNRGNAHEAGGRKDNAIADWRRALLLDASLVEARQSLARLGAIGMLNEEIAKFVGAGKALVEAHCSRCHAVGPGGASPNPRAPEFRGLAGRHPMLDLREPLTRGIAAPHDEMPRFGLREAEVDSIITYINDLSQKR